MWEYISPRQMRPQNTNYHKYRREGGRKAVAPVVGQKSVKFGQFSLKKNRNFSDCSPDLFTHSGGNVTASRIWGPPASTQTTMWKYTWPRQISPYLGRGPRWTSRLHLLTTLFEHWKVSRQSSFYLWSYTFQIILCLCSMCWKTYSCVPGHSC